MRIYTRCMKQRTLYYFLFLFHRALSTFFFTRVYLNADPCIYYVINKDGAAKRTLKGKGGRNGARNSNFKNVEKSWTGARDSKRSSTKSCRTPEMRASTILISGRSSGAPLISACAANTGFLETAQCAAVKPETGTVNVGGCGVVASTRGMSLPSRRSRRLVNKSSPSIAMRDWNPRGGINSSELEAVVAARRTAQTRRANIRIRRAK